MAGYAPTVQDFANIFADQLYRSLQLEMISCCAPGDLSGSRVCHLWYDLDMSLGLFDSSKAEIKSFAAASSREIAGMISRRCDGASSIRFLRAESKWSAQYRSVGTSCGISLVIEGVYDFINHHTLWTARLAYEVLPAKRKIGDTINIRTPLRFRVADGLLNFNP